MSNFSNITIDDNSSSTSVYEISPVVRFWSYLFLDIGSLMCTLFALYLLLFDRTLRQALQNHIIIVLLFIGLIYELTDIPWILYANYWGVLMFSSTTFYLIWVFVDYAFSLIQIALFAWATIERHILIFHDKWVATKKKRLLIHYVPIVVIPTYCFIYYCLVYFGPFCENSFDSFVAGSIYIPCVFAKTFLGTWDLIVHQIIPTLIIVIFSVLLILRVICQKLRLNQPIKWKRHRKMTIQLLSISSVYIIFNFPWAFLVFAIQYGLSGDAANIPLVYTGYFYYYVFFLFPFVCCASLPGIRRRLTERLCWYRPQRHEGHTRTTNT